MSQAATIESISTTAIVETVDMVEVGKHTHYFVQVRYIDRMARPDLEGKLSGWLRTRKKVDVGNVVSISFVPHSDRLGGVTFQPMLGG